MKETTQRPCLSIFRTRGADHRIRQFPALRQAVCLTPPRLQIKHVIDFVVYVEDFSCFPKPPKPPSDSLLD